MSQTAQRETDRLERLAGLMDSCIRVPGLGVRLGLDSLLGLIPGLGDAVSLVPAAYIILRAHRLGVPRRTLWRMALNSAVDTVVGAVPLLGDLFDVGFKSNHRNVALVKQHLAGRDGLGAG